MKPLKKKDNTIKRFKKEKVYGDEEEIWTDGETTAWVENIDGINCLAVGDATGCAWAYVPFRDMKNIINDWLNAPKKKT